MRQKRFDDDLMDDMKGMGSHNHMARHRNMGIFSIIPMAIGLAMTFVNIGLRIAQVITNIVFGTLFGITRSMNKPKDWNRMPGPDIKMNNPRPEPQRPNVKDEKSEPQPRVINLNEERAKQQAKTQKQTQVVKEESAHKKNWNIVIFLFALITSVTVLCTGRLLEAGAIFAGGFILMGFTSLIGSLFNKKPKSKPIKPEICSDEEVEKLLVEAETKLQNIRKIKANISKYDLQLKIEDLCQSGEKIVKTVRTTPDDLKLVRKFFYYYIDALGEITQKYIKISTSGVSDNEISQLMADTEKSFDDFKEIFTDYEKKLIERDLLNLKAEINVIKNES